MSLASLKGNASGTGTVTIESPNTNTDRTITLPDATGTLVLAGTTPSFNGIAFPATQSASADANTLDDYEEGTFTCTDASGAGLSITTSYASYTRIGRQVTVRFACTIPSNSSGAALQVGGLPFATGGYSSGVIGYNESPSADRSFLFQNGVTYIQIRNPIGTRTNGNYSSNEFHGQGTYFV